MNILWRLTVRATQECSNRRTILGKITGESKPKAPLSFELSLSLSLFFFFFSFSHFRYIYNHIE